MKQIFLLILCVFFTLITSANAGELYHCIDSNGKSIITDTPQDGMTNCVLRDSYDDPTPQQRAQQKRERAAQNQAYEQQIQQQELEQERKKAEEIKCYTQQSLGILVGNGPAVLPGATYRICKDKYGKIVSKDRL